MVTSRRAELAANLARARGRIAAACAAAGRSPQGVTLVAVTKTWPIQDIAALADLGVRDFGENRDQEARRKAQELAGLPITWHFVGQVQRNKAASVASYADIVESVDRLPLVGALDVGASRAGRRIGTCIQVSLAPDEDRGSAARGGARPADVETLAGAVEAASCLDLRGVMAVAPLGADPVGAFERLGRMHRALLRDHPDAWMVSAGMSSDLEAAIACGATHVRLGSALLGHRESLK